MRCFSLGGGEKYNAPLHSVLPCRGGRLSCLTRLLSAKVRGQRTMIAAVTRVRSVRRVRTVETRMRMEARMRTVVPGIGRRHCHRYIVRHHGWCDCCRSCYGCGCGFRGGCICSCICGGVRGFCCCGGGRGNLGRLLLQFSKEIGDAFCIQPRAGGEGDGYGRRGCQNAEFGCEMLEHINGKRKKSVMRGQNRLCTV